MPVTLVMGIYIEIVINLMPIMHNVTGTYIEIVIKHMPVTLHVTGILTL